MHAHTHIHVNLCSFLLHAVVTVPLPVPGCVPVPECVSVPECVQQSGGWSARLQPPLTSKEHKAAP